ncbi:hypothetical protein CUU80_09415 [Bifidobacterium scaligerum]|uniref:Uncharacterized protein n=1 Tax=Bifidobacterium scaligerum TaxID=2052656 RepID=A0A2M9HNL6_9BIFI|nr:hypothetical protein CUU80_09415 [Bifidobacterium scaligerum]
MADAPILACDMPRRGVLAVGWCRVLAGRLRAGYLAMLLGMGSGMLASLRSLLASAWCHVLAGCLRNRVWAESFGRFLASCRR